MFARLRARLLARLAEALAPLIFQQIKCAMTHHLRSRAEDYSRHMIRQSGGRRSASEDDLDADRLIGRLFPTDPARPHDRPHWRGSVQ